MSLRKAYEQAPFGSGVNSIVFRVMMSLGTNIAIYTYGDPWKEVVYMAGILSYSEKVIITIKHLAWPESFKVWTSF